MSSNGVREVVRDELIQPGQGDMRTPACEHVIGFRPRSRRCSRPTLLGRWLRAFAETVAARQLSAVATMKSYGSFTAKMGRLRLAIPTWGFRWGVSRRDEQGIAVFFLLD